MKHPCRVPLALFVIVAAAVTVGAQDQDLKARKVTSGTATLQPAADPLAAWQAEYEKALDQARQLQASRRSKELGEQLELDLAALDEALREYVRVSERLRHKNRALTVTVDSMNVSNQMESQTFQTMSNALKVASDVEKAGIENTR